MRKAKLIGSNLKLACDNLLAVKKLGPSDRAAPILMFYAAENLLQAIFTSEDEDFGMARSRHGNHQLDRMLDDLSGSCAVRVKFEEVISLVAYATTYRYPTPTGNLPAPPSEEEANAYYSSLVDILDTCAKHFHVDVKLEAPEAGSVSPIRDRA